MGKEIIEKNILIAEFMGFIIAPNKERPLALYTNGEEGMKAHCRMDKVKYHTSWDWLIPVVQKIYTLVDFRQSEPYYKVSKCFIVTPIDIVYRLVIDFIHYYNTVTNTPNHESTN